MSAAALLFLLLLPFLLVGQAGPSWAGAWVMPAGKSKATLSHLRHRQSIDTRLRVRPFRLDLQETDTALYVEHGLTHRLTGTAKLGRSALGFGGFTAETRHAGLGLSLDAPYLASGVLPPYTFRLMRRLLPRARLQRERRASVTATVMTRQSLPSRSGTAMTLSLADKINARRLHVLQEVDVTVSRIGGREERSALYRFSLGHGPFSLASQTEQFDDGGNFAALSHSYRLGWSPPTADWQVMLGRGQRRIAQPYLPGARIHRGRVWLLEIQRKF